MPNDTTTRGYPLPHPDNVAREDAQRIRDAIQAISEDLESMGVEPATETEIGGVRLATAAEATAGTATDAVPVVKRVKDMITSAVNVVSNALTALTGRVTQAESDIDALADGLLATGNTLAGHTATINAHTTSIAAKLDKSDNLAALTDKAASRTNLGLGSIATKNIATTAEIRSNTNSGAIQVDAAWAAAGWIDLGVKSGSVVIDGSTGSRFIVRLGGNVTISVANVKSGQPIEIACLQDASGGRTVSWSGFLWPNGVAPSVFTGAGSWAVMYSGVWNEYAGMVGNGWKVN